jgi:hypothetical protein
MDTNNEARGPCVFVLICGFAQEEEVESLSLPVENSARKRHDSFSINAIIHP